MLRFSWIVPFIMSWRARCRFNTAILQRGVSELYNPTSDSVITFTSHIVSKQISHSFSQQRKCTFQCCVVTLHYIRQSDNHHECNSCKLVPQNSFVILHTIRQAQIAKRHQSNSITRSSTSLQHCTPYRECVTLSCHCRCSCNTPPLPRTIHPSYSMNSGWDVRCGVSIPFNSLNFRGQLPSPFSVQKTLFLHNS